MTIKIKRIDIPLIYDDKEKFDLFRRTCPTSAILSLQSYMRKPNNFLWLMEEAADSFNLFYSAWKKNGGNLLLADGLRTPKDVIYLHKTNPKAANRPENVIHLYGLAVDYSPADLGIDYKTGKKNQWEDLAKFASDFGWTVSSSAYRSLKTPNCWHLEYTKFFGDSSLFKAKIEKRIKTLEKENFERLVFRVAPLCEDRKSLELKNAILSIQRANGLERTGILDTATKKTLVLLDVTYEKIEQPLVKEKETSPKKEEPKKENPEVKERQPVLVLSPPMERKLKEQEEKEHLEQQDQEGREEDIGNTVMESDLTIDESLICDICGFPAKSARGLALHMKVHEKKDEDDDTEGNETNEEY